MDNKIKFAFSTHKGYVRERQEDVYGHVGNKLFVVADGLGGMPAGHVAAKVAVEMAQKVFRQAKADQQVEEILINIFKQADAAIEQEASKDANKQGMCTTMVTAFIRQNKWWLANIGDSRGYFFCPDRDSSADNLHQVTDDHEDYHGIITRAVGKEEEAIPDIFTGEAASGDILLLATDGLFDLVSDEEIVEVLAKKANVQQKADRLVQMALEAGGRDNVTVCLIKWV